jgi:hypothetical protein
MALMQLLAQGNIYGFEGTAAARLFLGGFTLIVVVALLMVRLPLMAWLIAAILLITALEPGVNVTRDGFLPTWLLPIQSKRAEIHLGLSILVVIALLATGKFNIARLPAQALFMLAIMLYTGVLTFLHEGAKRAIETIGFVSIVIPAIVLAARAVLDTPGGGFVLVRAMLVAATVWAGACSVQFLLEPAYLLTQGRFQGLLGNPQAAALLIAPVITMATWSILNDPIKRYRILWIGIVAIYLLFLLWTGSRTGLVMSVGGVVAVLYRRSSRVALMLPVIAGLAIALSLLANALQIQNNLDRIVSTTNTRSSSTQALLMHIQDSPVIGIGWTNLEATENSYLAAWAAYGISMFLLVALFLVLSVALMFRLFVKRHELGVTDSALVDVVIAYHAIYFVGANAEGFIFGRSTPSQTMMGIFAAMSGYLFFQLRANQHATPVDPHEHDYELSAQDAFEYGDHPELGDARPTVPQT